MSNCPKCHTVEFNWAKTAEKKLVQEPERKLEVR